MRLCAAGVTCPMNAAMIANTGMLSGYQLHAVAVRHGRAGSSPVARRPIGTDRINEFVFSAKGTERLEPPRISHFN